MTEETSIWPAAGGIPTLPVAVDRRDSWDPSCRRVYILLAWEGCFWNKKPNPTYSPTPQVTASKKINRLYQRGFCHDLLPCFGARAQLIQWIGVGKSTGWSFIEFCGSLGQLSQGKTMGNLDQTKRFKRRVCFKLFGKPLIVTPKKKGLLPISTYVRRLNILCI